MNIYYDFYSHFAILVRRRGSYRKQELITLHKCLCSHPGVLGGSLLLMFLVFCVMDFALFAIIICFLCPMLSMSVDCSFLYLTFINYYSSLPLYHIHNH